MESTASATEERQAYHEMLAQQQLERVENELSKMYGHVRALTLDKSESITVRATAAIREIHWAVWNARLDDLQAAVARAAYYEGQAEDQSRRPDGDELR